MLFFIWHLIFDNAGGYEECWPWGFIARMDDERDMEITTWQINGIYFHLTKLYYGE